jgi:catechol 2,3-dioxygenase-like lactoylglutathione lyase family enzyme
VPEPFDRLDHVVVAVRDLEAATLDHARLLGRPAAWRGAHPGLGTENALFRLENTCLELLAPAAPDGLGRVLAERLEREGEGLLALAFGTQDAPRCAATLRSRGLEADALEEEQGVAREGGAVRRWVRVAIPPEATRGVALFGIERRGPDAWADPGPGAAPETCVSALDHVVVTSPDLDAAASLYRDRLGLRLALERSLPERGVRLLFFRVGGVTLELAGSPDAAAGKADRLWGLAWRVADVAAAAARLRDAGVAVSEVRRGVAPGTQVCSVRSDTHGVATLLIGPLAG